MLNECGDASNTEAAAAAINVGGRVRRRVVRTNPRESLKVESEA